MTIEVARLVTYVEARTSEHDAKLRASGKLVDDFGAKGEQLSKKGGGYFEGALKGAAKFGLVMGGVGLAFGAAIGPAADFDSKMAQIRATSGASNAELLGLRNTALQLGMATDVGAVSASDAADAIFELGKAGISVQAITGGVAKSVLQLAAAAGPEFGVANAAALAAKALNTFKLDASQATRVVNVLVGAANASSIGLSELKQGFSDVAAVAANMGLSIEDTSAAIAILGDNGLSAGTAGGALKTMLLNLQPVTKAQTKLFRELGIVTKDGSNQFFDAKGNVRDLAAIAGVLKTALAGLTKQQIAQKLETMFGAEAITAATILYGEGAEGVKAFTEQMIKQGDAAKVAADMGNNLQDKWSAFMGTIQTLAIVGGTLLLPFLSILTDSLNGLVGGGLSWLADPATAAGFSAVGDAIKTGVGAAFQFIGEAAAAVWPIIQQVFTFISENAGSLAAVIGGVLTPTFIAWGGAAASAIGGIMAALAPLLIKFALIAGAAALLKAAWDNDFGGMRTTLTDWWGKAGPIFENVKGWLGENIPKALDGMGKAWKWVQDNAITPVFDYLKSPEVSSTLSRVGDGIKNGLGAAWNGLMSVGSGVWDNVLKPFFNWVQEPKVASGIKKVGDTIGDFARNGWNILMSIGSGVWENAIQPFFKWISTDEVSGNIKKTANAIGTAAEGGLRWAWGVLSEAAKVAWAGMQDIVNFFQGKTTFNVQAAIDSSNTLRDTWKAVGDVLGRQWKTIELNFNTFLHNFQEGILSVVMSAQALAKIPGGELLFGWSKAINTDDLIKRMGDFKDKIRELSADLGVIDIDVVMDPRFTVLPESMRRLHEKIAESKEGAKVDWEKEVGILLKYNPSIPVEMTDRLAQMVENQRNGIKVDWEKELGILLTYKPSIAEGTSAKLYSQLDTLLKDATKSVSEKAQETLKLTLNFLPTLSSDSSNRLWELVGQARNGIKVDWAKEIPAIINANPQLSEWSKSTLMGLASYLTAIFKAEVDGQTVNTSIGVNATATMTAAQKALAWATAYQQMVAAIGGVVMPIDVLLQMAPKFTDDEVGGGGGSIGGGLFKGGKVGMAALIGQHVQNQVKGMTPIEVLVPVSVKMDFGTEAAKAGLDMATAGIKGALGASGSIDTSAAQGAIAAAKSAQAAIMSVVTTVGTAITSMVAAVQSRLATLASLMSTAGRAGVLALVVAILSGIAPAGSAAASVGTAARTGVSTSFSPGALSGIGVMGMAGLTGGIRAGGGMAIGAAAGVAAGVRGAVAAGMAAGYFIQSGYNVGRGLAAGITASTTLAVSAARYAANAAKNAINAELAIKSPSGEGIKSGKWLIAGLVKGMMDNAPQAAAAGVSVADVIKGGLSQGIADNKGLLATTEAAIKQVVELAKRVVGKGTKELMEAFSSITGAVGGAFDLAGKIGSAQKDWVQPTAAFLKKVFHAIDNILVSANAEIQKRKGMLTEVNANLSKFMGEIIGGFAGAVDLISKLGDKDFRAVGQATIEAFFRGLDGFLARANHLLVKYRGMFDETRAALAEFMGRIVDGLGKAIGPLQALAKEDFAVPDDLAMGDFFYGMDRFLKRALPLVDGWTKMWDEKRVQLAEFIGSVVDSLGGAAGTLKDLASESFAVPTEAVMKNFFYAVDTFLKHADKLILGWTGLWDDTRANLAGFIGSVVDGLGKAVAALTNLAKEDLALPTLETIKLFLYRVDQFLVEADKLVLGWTGMWDKTRTELASFMGSVVDGLGKAMGTLTNLAKEDFAVGGISAIDALMYGIDEFLKRADRLVLGWTGQWDKTRVDLAGFMGSVVDGLGKAIGTLRSLADEKFAVGSIPAIDALMWGVDEFLKRADKLVLGWTGVWDKTRVELAGFMGSIVDGVGKAIGVLKSLADEKFAVGSTKAMDAFFLGVDEFLKRFSAKIATWKPIGIKENGELAGFVGSIVDSVGKAIDDLQKLSGKDFAVGSTKAIDTLFAGVDYFLAEFTKKAASWSVRANEKSAEIAKYVGAVVTEIGKAIDPIVKLLKWDVQEVKAVAPTMTGDWGKGGTLAKTLTSGMDQFFDGLDYFLAEFSKRAADYKTKATEETAKLAGYIGEIASNITKALDPILKMKDAQAITGGQIEGAMANVHFALYHFDRVMTGLPGGDWLTRAKEFALGIGDIFGNLKTSLGVIGEIGAGGGAAAGGFAQLFEGLRALWMGVFGPATEPGTFLHAIFGKPDGMFNWMDQNIPGYMAYSAGIWKQALQQLQEALGRQLGEMKLALANDAYEVGRAIAQGIADGIGNVPGGPPPPGPPSIPPVNPPQGRGLLLPPPTPGYGSGYGYEGIGGGGGGGTVINNPIYIDGARVEDPDAHRILSKIATHKGRTSR